MTKNNQLAILKSLKDGKKPEEIAVELKIDLAILQEYLDELKDILDKPEPIAPGVKKAILEKVSHELMKIGLTKVSINNKINRVLKSLSKEQISKVTAEGLLGDCLSLLNANDLMINKTGSGNSGVSIMTEAGSQKGEGIVAAPKKSPHVYPIF